MSLTLFLVFLRMASKIKRPTCEYRDKCLLLEKRIYFECFLGMLCHQAPHCRFKYSYLKPIVIVQYELF